MTPPKRRSPQHPPQTLRAKQEHTPANSTMLLAWWAIVTGAGYGLILLAAVLGMAGFFDDGEPVTVPPLAEVSHAP